MPPPADVLSHSNSVFLHPAQRQPSSSSLSSPHRKRSTTMTTASAASHQSKLSAALGFNGDNTGMISRSRRNSTATESSVKRRFSNMMLRRPSQSTSASSSSSGNSSDKKSTSSGLSRRQSLTRATASSLAKVVPSFHNKITNTESPKPSQSSSINLLSRRRNSMMALSNGSGNTQQQQQQQPSTPKPSGSTAVKLTSSSKPGAKHGGSSANSSKWFGLRRPSSPAIPSPSTSSIQPSPRPRRYSMIPTATAKTTPLTIVNQQEKPSISNHHMGKHHNKHDSKLATLAKQQQRTNTVYQETEKPNRSISNSPTLKPRNNFSARHVDATTTITKASAAPADKATATTVGVPSVVACAAAMAPAAPEHSAAPQDSYFEQHQHPTETASGSPPHYYQYPNHQRSTTKTSSENCSRLSSRMLDSDISISSLESRRSSVSSLRTVQSACRHSVSNNNNSNTVTATATAQYNNVTQHPAWLASAGFMRRTKCTACNPTSSSEHRRSLSRSSSMYDVATAAVAAQHQQSSHSTLRRFSRTSLTDENGIVKPNYNRRIASADGIIDQPLTPIPNSTAAFIRQHQQLYGNNRSTATPTTTAAATAAAAMAAAAAVISAVAASAATTNPDPANDKWMRLIGNCINHSSKLERLAHDLITSEQNATDVLEVHESIEESQKSRDQEYQIRVKECEALVRVQREMLIEIENLLSEQGFKKEINPKQQQHQHELTTPPPSSPSESSASSASSMSDDQQEEQQEQDEDQVDQDSSSEKKGIQKLSSVLSQEQDAERSDQDQKEQAEQSEEQEEPNQEDQVTQDSPETYQELIQPQSDDNEQDKPWSEIVEETVSQIRWNVGQWVGGGVGTGQIVKCEIGADGLMSTIIVAGTGVTTEPQLLPQHLMQHADKSVYYHRYILYIEREDRKHRFTLMPSTRWIEDDQVKQCQFSYADQSSHTIQCESEFDWLARRHHCRRCGHIFCNTHSSNRLPLFDAQNTKAEWSRVCDTCFYDLAGSSLFHPSDDR
ncbi:hypothetical protein INT45_006124 [Circinella minor]|uniref:FYVE-type domain-containing protein n=1 Tax=Circinella minor TaxID=1195481 RepID=A0A8H7S861_9FUNG|nr:hypothetical protein INT45_006124 [Circinella minor]